MTAVQSLGLIDIDSSQSRLQTFFRLTCRRWECRQPGRSHLRIRYIISVAGNTILSLILYSHIELLLQQAGGSTLIELGLKCHARLQAHGCER